MMYCVELRDFTTGEQRAMCMPKVVVAEEIIPFGVVIRLNEGLSKYLKVLTKLVITKPESAKCAEDIVRNFYNSNDKILFKAGK